MTASHELFEHTADVGLRVYARTLPELFAEAARGLLALLVDDPGDVATEDTEEIVLEADELEDLLVDWLSELLFLHESRGLLLCSCKVEIEGNRLCATVRGEPFDPKRHRPGSEVKAVTYHGLSIARDPDGYVAEVVLDI